MPIVVPRKTTPNMTAAAAAIPMVDILKTTPSGATQDEDREGSDISYEMAPTTAANGRCPLAGNMSRLVAQSSNPMLSPSLAYPGVR